MVTERTFVFTFAVSDEFLRESPASSQWVELAKQRIARQVAAVGPRGGVYRLVTPPDEWRQSRDAYYDFIHNLVRFGTRRKGRYVRPDRVTPDLRLGSSVEFDSVTLPVQEGRALLPDGRIVETPSRSVVVPVAT